MDVEIELRIFRLLRESAGVKYSAKEVGKAIDRHKFQQNRNWAKPALDKFASKGLLEREEHLYWYQDDWED